MSNKITGKVLAIQLGRKETRIVLLGNGNEILHAVAMPTTAGAVDDGVIRNPEAVRAMLKKALAEPEFKRVRQAVFTLCTSQIITETVTTPELPASKLEKLLRANADMYFPVDTQEYNLVWQVIGPKQGDGSAKELAVQLWAVPNAMLQPYYSVANACGLSVAAIDYCGHSMATAADASFAAPVKGKERRKLDLNKEITFGAKKKEKPAEEAPASERVHSGETKLHLLLDQDLLGMTFVQNGQVVMQRVIRCGSDPTYQFSELAMMLEYFRSMEGGWDNTISGVVSGSYADDRQMVADLADMLGIPVERMDASYDLSLTLCAGAARTELDFGIPSLNAAGKARKEVQGQLWQYVLLLGCGLVLVAVILYTLSARLIWNTNISTLENESQALTVQYAQVSEYAENYNNYEKLYNAYSTDWETIFASLQTYNDNLVLVMDELEEILPDKSSVVGMEIGASGLNVTFAAETKEEAAYLIMALRDMQYADLMEISDLVGGGNGPAESYGSAAAEQAPAEGSSSSDLTESQWNAMYEAVFTDLEAYAVAYNLGMGVGTTDQIGNLKGAYSLEVDNQYDSLADLKKAVGSKLTYEVRSNAFTAACTMNPFAMDAAESMLYMDYLTGGSLGPYIERQLEIRDSSIISVYRHRSVQDLQEDIEILVDIMTTYNSSYDALTEAEKVICSNEEMEAWYVYYLEAELNESESSLEQPYLDMDAVISDVLDGEFNSQFSGLNSVLNSLISAQTHELIDQVNAELNPPDPTNPADPTDPTDPNAPTEPTDPSDPTDPTEGEGDDITTDLFLEMILKMYLQYGEMIPGSEEYIDDIIKYFEEGSSNTELDEILDNFINSGKTDDILKSLLLMYQTDPDSIAINAIREMFDNYYNNGTTGNQFLDAWIERCEEALKDVVPPGPTKPSDPTDPSDPTEPSKPDAPEVPDEATEEAARWLKYYLTFGTTGDTNDTDKDGLSDGDEVIVWYLLNGGLDDKETQKILDDYVRAKGVDAELKNLLFYYLYNRGSIGNEAITTMFDNYYEGTTYNDALDERIKALGKEIAADAIQDAINNANSGGGGGGGQQAGPTDKRIFFAVVLNYNEELRNEELNRKGLDYTDKVKPLEVEE